MGFLISDVMIRISVVVVMDSVMLIFSIEVGSGSMMDSIMMIRFVVIVSDWIGSFVVGMVLVMFICVLFL